MKLDWKIDSMSKGHPQLFDHLYGGELWTRDNPLSVFFFKRGRQCNLKKNIKKSRRASLD
jgi:hypothetical protein